jgi:hypothetical protein
MVEADDEVLMSRVSVLYGAVCAASDGRHCVYYII